MDTENLLKYLNWDQVFFLDMWLLSQELPGETPWHCLLNEVRIIHHRLFQPWNLKLQMSSAQNLILFHFFPSKCLEGNTKHLLSWDSCPHTFPTVFLGILQNMPCHSRLLSCNVNLFLFFAIALAGVWLWWLLPYSRFISSWFCTHIDINMYINKNVSCRPCNYTCRFSLCQTFPVIAASSVRQWEIC